MGRAIELRKADGSGCRLLSVAEEGNGLAGNRGLDTLLVQAHAIDALLGLAGNRGLDTL